MAVQAPCDEREFRPIEIPIIADAAKKMKYTLKPVAQSLANIASIETIAHKRRHSCLTAKFSADNSCCSQGVSVWSIGDVSTRVHAISFLRRCLGIRESPDAERDIMSIDDQIPHEFTVIIGFVIDAP